MKVFRRRDDRAIRAVAMCRGEGVGYVVLASDRCLEGLRTSAACKDGTWVPSALYPVTMSELKGLLVPHAAYVWIATLPLLSCDCALHVAQNGSELLSVAFPARQSKVSSRLLSMTKPQVAAAIRGYERLQSRGRTRVSIQEVWPAADDQVVWRVHVILPTGDESAQPYLRVFDDQAREQHICVVLMEDHVVPSKRDHARMIRLLTYSCRLPERMGSFFVVAGLGDMASSMGFDGMNAARAAGLIAGARGMTGGASGDARYARWFQAHRVTDAELRWQRSSCAELPEGDYPLISIVMPVYQTPRAFLEEALRSVLAQSYDRWELIVVNASGPWPEVDEVLAAHADSRIRVVEAPNRSIAENTNVGIAAASGSYVGFMDHDDVLEPDALWCFARAIVANAQVDVLYSDEDHMSEDGVHGPAFKTFPNYGKLYCHNYVTHLLMVSRRVLDLTERSGPEVTGAQDYDLTLKAFEVAREIVHVPRVLYHWREHEGSTSGGGDQKPFAHVAGARALEAHLARRGIAARVEDGVLPYTYRVRYELPDPVPKMSIVIPTRDHAGLLRACVQSILQKSTYQDYEIVLVENNSEEPQTFALYDELTQTDSRVSVVVWKPEIPGMFNYSAIVNYGVSNSSGDLVVLLNNDTEVIEPSWLEEMAGCLMRPEVGIVGAKLLFGDGLIQHVGMVGNPDGNNCHVCQNLAKDTLGPGYAAAMPGDYSMVTGACQMVPRAVYDELGGYDEDLAVGFNDGDFCLRAKEAGYAVTVCAYALLYHREFSSRGREQTDARLRERFLQERARMIGKHAAFFAQGDPALNPNVDPYSAYFNLRHGHWG